MGPAIPLAIQAGAAIAGSIAAKRAQKKAQQAMGTRGPEEATALQGAQGAGGALTGAGQGLTGGGAANTGQAAGFYGKLLGGDRATMALATAGPRAGLTDIYRGAERGLERSGVRGASRDRAKGELNRERASHIAGLTTGVQPAAAQALSQIGAQQSATGGQMLGSGGNLWANLMGQGQGVRERGWQAGEQAGTAAGQQWGGLVRDVGGAFANRGSGNGNPKPLKSTNLGSTGAGSIGRNPVGLMPAVQPRIGMPRGL